MCYYRFYKFQGCGHTSYSSTPVRYCENAKSADATETQTTPNPPKSAVTKTTGAVIDLEAGSQPAKNAQLPSPLPATGPPAQKTITPASHKRNLQPCEIGLTHPRHTHKIETQCGECIRARDERLRLLESLPEVQVRRITRTQNRQPAKRQSEDLILQGRADKAPKVDSGVWAVGSKWMEGWKRSG